jgi:hypothetical protein
VSTLQRLQDSVDEGIFIQNVANALKDKLAFSVYLSGSSLEQTITYATPESTVSGFSTCWGLEGELKAHD